MRIEVGKKTFLWNINIIKNISQANTAYNYAVSSNLLRSKRFELSQHATSLSLSFRMKKYI